MWGQGHPANIENFRGILVIVKLFGTVQVKNLEEAARELWKRRDEADRDLIASLRADAGLPTQEEIFDISPFSDEDSDPALPENESSRSLKVSLKGWEDKSQKKNKEYGKKSSKKKSGKKKGNGTSFTSGTDAENFGRHTDGQLFGHKSGDNMNGKIQFSGEHATSSNGAMSEAAISTLKQVDEVMEATRTKTSRTIKIKNNKPLGLTNSEDSGMLKTGQGPKLVIHLGGRNRNANGMNSVYMRFLYIQSVNFFLNALFYLGCISGKVPWSAIQCLRGFLSGMNFL